MTEIVIGTYKIRVDEVNNSIEFSVWPKITGMVGIFSAMCAVAFGLAIPLSLPSDYITWAFNISVIVFVASVGSFLTIVASLKSGCGVRVSHREGFDNYDLYSSTYVFSGDAVKDAAKVKELIDEYKQRATIKWIANVKKLEEKKSNDSKCHCQYKTVMSKVDGE